MDGGGRDGEGVAHTCNHGSIRMPACISDAGLPYAAAAVVHVVGHRVGAEVWISGASVHGGLVDIDLPSERCIKVVDVHTAIFAAGIDVS